MIAHRYDCVVVGAGAAGCVLASRLSENPARTVLLIEAGRDYIPGEEPESVRSCFPHSVSEPDFFWPDLIAEVGADPGGGRPRFSRPYQQARLMGGGSSIMGMLALRGLPADYDEWARAGATGWNWESVLPFFRRLERDSDFRGRLHGDAGPIPIRRHGPGDWPPFCAAVGAAIRDRGFEQFADANGCSQDGLFPLPMSNLPSGRVSSAMGYLTDEVRRRPNLQIMGEATARRLLFAGTRCVGVRVGAQGREIDVGCEETIVAAGAIHSPALLQRSGIGPASALQSLGIDVISDRPGVGANLMNHPAVYVATWLDRAARQSPGQPGWSQNALRYSSGMAACPTGDMFLFAFNKTGTHGLGRAIGQINVSAYKSFSRGSVEIRSADPDERPTIRFNLLDDTRDRERLTDGVRLALELLVDPRVAGVHQESFVAAGKIVARVSRPRASARALSSGLSKMFDHLPMLRRLALAPMRVDPTTLLADQDLLDQFVLQHAFPMGHVSGTCRMGNAADQGAVCDADCRVIGVAGLRVADASIMPTIPTANTHIPTLMLAEKAASLI